MKKRQSYTVVGFAAGAFFGISTGVAVGGDAYNGVWIFGALGALIGWLFGDDRQSDQKREETLSPDDPLDAADVRFQAEKKDGRSARDNSLLGVALRMLAGIWNFHIDVLEYVGLLPLFQRNPLAFSVFPVCIIIFFQPLFLLYIMCYAAARQYGLSAEDGYRAKID